MTPNELKISTTSLPSSNEFAAKIHTCIQKTNETGRPFFVVLVQLSNIESFARRRNKQEALNLLREIGTAVRKVIHPSQFVGYYQNGLGLIFDAVDPGMVDRIAQRLVIVIQNAIRLSNCNDFQGRWTDIIFQFLHPNNPGVVFPRVGWALFPRDGEDFDKLILRAQYMIAQG